MPDRHRLALHLATAAAALLVLTAGLPVALYPVMDDWSHEATPWTFDHDPYTARSVKEICLFNLDGCSPRSDLVLAGGPALLLAACLAACSAFGFARRWRGALPAQLGFAAASVGMAGAFALLAGFDHWFDRWWLGEPAPGPGAHAIAASLALLLVAGAVGWPAPTRTDKPAGPLASA